MDEGDPVVANQPLVRLDAADFQIQSRGEALEIEMNIPLVGGGDSACRPTVDGDWAGACAGAITGDSLRRIPESDGHGAASYDPTGAAAALSCP